jgi:hypothetical protein
VILRDAARATLAAGSASVARRCFLEPGGEIWRSEEGAVDFTRRRTRTTVASRGAEPLVEQLLERYPWLDHGDDDEELGPAESVYAGTASWFVYPGGASARIAVGDPGAARRGHADPAWIVEVLEHVQREDRRGDDRFGFLVDLTETGSALELPPHRGRGRPRIAGEAWLDEAGRISRATWSRFDRARSRKPSDRRVWTTTDLWDFGTPVEIALPPPSREPPLALGLVRLARELRRRKRGYSRRCSASG